MKTENNLAVDSMAEATATKFEIISLHGQDCIKFTFVGKFTEDQAILLGKQWNECFAQNKNKKYHVIFEATKMVDYQAHAREIWQKHIIELKDQIDTIWVVSSSIIITAGAKIMKVFTSFDIKIVGEEREIIF